ncbi:MAG: prepilin-type N-terminal cleavage/methylation domain-containing protein [Synergistaceae bacterium]|jgi:prepilin-type N-terminal cleavage/methylation domain-containing protein|nr:prepilin-type N-terminal cleavage/methylation domain-containing protein [Synergistaceae bacterium]
MKRAFERKRAFTLIEILVAVALTGMLVSLTFAPVVYAVRRVAETEESYSGRTALRRAALFMAGDVAAGFRLTRETVRAIRHETLGGGDEDVLVVASAAPAKQNAPGGSVVYKIVSRSFLRGAIPGLYRWVLPGILPGDADPDRLEEEEGQLVLPYVTELKLSFISGSDWIPDYKGALPPAMRVALARGEEREEYVFSFPQ